MMNQYRLPTDSTPTAPRQAPAPPVNPWLAGLDPARLARVQATQKAMGLSGKPPDPVAHQVAAIENRARATAEAAWVANANEQTESLKIAMQPYAEQLQAQHARTEAERQKKRNEQARQQAQRDEEQEDRRARQQSAILALSADASASIAAIRSEIASILEA